MKEPAIHGRVVQTIDAARDRAAWPIKKNGHLRPLAARAATRPFGRAASCHRVTGRPGAVRHIRGSRRQTDSDHAAGVRGDVRKDHRTLS